MRGLTTQTIDGQAGATMEEKNNTKNKLKLEKECYKMLYFTSSVTKVKGWYEASQWKMIQGDKMLYFTSSGTKMKGWYEASQWKMIQGDGIS